MSTEGVILDVGCGPTKEPGAVGIDQFSLQGVDVVCDLNADWPLQSAVFEQVVFRHSINHLSDLGHALTEAERVSRRGGKVKIIAPHFSSDNIFTDPTVKFFTGYRTMEYYCTNTTIRYRYYASTTLKLVYRRIHLYKSRPNGWIDRTVNALVWPLETVINRFPRIYEKFFCFIVRANEIVYVMEVA